MDDYTVTSDLSPERTPAFQLLDVVPIKGNRRPEHQMQAQET